MEPISLALGLAQMVGPKVAGLIAGEKGEKVANKVLGIAQAVTGQSDPARAVEQVQADPTLAAEFQRQVQDNEHELKVLALKDKKNARSLYKAKNEMADHIARRVITWNLPFLAILVVANVAVAIFIKDSAVAQLLGNLIGAACQSLWQERRTIIEFFFGAGLGGGDDQRPEAAAD